MQLNNHSDYDSYDLVKTRLSDLEGDVQEKTITVFESGLVIGWFFCFCLASDSNNLVSLDHNHKKN